MQSHPRWTLPLAMLLLSSLGAFAQTYVWDASSATSNQQSGSGQWLGGTTWWDGTNNVAWNNSGTVIAQLGATTPSASLTPLVVGNTITITTSTVNVAGLNFMSLVGSPLTLGNQFTVAGASGGTLHFVDNAIITVGDNSSTGSNFATLASSLLVTGNNLTMQKSNGTAQQFFRFDMTSNPGLTGSLLIKGDMGGIFVRAAAPGTFSAMSAITVESNSCLSLAGAGSYAVPLSIAGTGGTGQYGAIRVDTNGITITAPITLTADAGIQTNTGGVTNTVLSGGISGNFGLSRYATGTGIGTLSFTSANTYTGATTLGRAGNFAGGVTILDFTAATAPTADILYSNSTPAGALALIGGSNSATVLNLTGKASTANSQRFDAVSVTGSSTTIGGLAVINLTSGTSGSMSLSLGNITRSGTGMLAFTAPASGMISTTTASGFLGPWATFRTATGSTTWAQVAGGVVTGGFVGDLAYTTGTAISALAGYTAAKNLTISSASSHNITTTGATTDINTLSMTDTCNDRTIALGGNILRLGASTSSGGGIQLTPTAANLVISGGTLTGGGPTLNNAGQIILTNNSATSTLQIDATIANNGSGAMMLLVNGISSSKVVLTGTNTFSGGTTIASGAVEMRSAGALGTAGTVTVLEGAALQISGGITVSRTLTVGGNGINNDGAIRNLSGNNTISSVVTTNAPLRIQSDQGTLTFFNVNATNNAINPSSTSSTLVFSGAGDIVVNSRINNTTQATTKEGTGRLTLGGDNSVITTGTFTVNGGVLRVTNTAALGSVNGITTVAAGASLELAFASDSILAEPVTFDGGGFNGTGAIHNVTGNNTLSGPLSIGATALTTIVADSGTTLTISGTLRSGATSVSTRTVSLGGAGTINITGAMTNGTSATFQTGLTKIDAGTANLRVASTYTGPTTAKGGILNIDFANAAAASHLIPSGNALTLNGGTFQVTGKDGATNTQGFSSTTLTAGRSTISVASGSSGTANLELGTITRASGSGSATDITLPTTGAITTTTLNTNGIVNGGLTVGTNTWATSAATQSTSIAWNNAADTIAIGGLVNGSQVSFTGTAPGGLTAGMTYYVVSSTGSSFQVAATEGGTPLLLSNDGTAAQVNQAGAITGLTSYSSTFTAGTNVDVASGAGTLGTVSVNSMRFNAPAGSTLSLSGTLTDTSGGILVTSAVTGDVMIQSNSSTVRTLATSALNDFTVHQYGSGLLTIASTVSLGTATAFTKTGPGPMTFAGTSSVAGVQIRATQGALNFVGDNRFTGASDPGLTIGSANVSAQVSFGNGASSGAESLSALTVLGTGSSLIGSGSAIYTIGLQNSGTTDLRALTIGGAGPNENNLAFEAYLGGTVQMGSANTYAGRTNIGRATLEVSSIANAGTASSLGTGSTAPTIDMNDTTSTSATVSTLRYLGTSNAVTDRAIRLQTDGVTMPSLTAVIENNGSGTLKFTSAFSVTGTTTLARLFRLSGTNTGINEIVSIGNGPSSVVSLDKAGAGTWALTGNSTYTGGTTISGGTLQLGTGGTAGMVGTGDIAISSGAFLATSRSDSLTIANNITGAGSLVVNNGAGGTTVLSSIGNTYSGGTTVNSGTLMLTNTAGSGTGSGSINVETAATLAGSGRIALASGNSVSICGILSIGEVFSTAADMEISTAGTGTLLLDGGSVLLLDLTSGAGSGGLNGTNAADKLVVGGLLTIAPRSTLRIQNLSGLSGWAAGDAWQIFDWSTLSGTTIGTFTTLDLPTLSDNLQWDTSALYSTGLISISIAPEPGRMALLGCGLVLLALRRRRPTA